MGPVRYLYCGVRRWILPPRTYPATIMYKEEPVVPSECPRYRHEDCDVCAFHSAHVTPVDEVADPYRCVVRVYAPEFYVVRCTCSCVSVRSCVSAEMVLVRRRTALVCLC